jgi:cytochrome c biogenesis protein CcmG/thiol:disulfide interchange protein DsbE
MSKLIKTGIVVMILGIFLAAGCAQSPPRENVTAPDFQLKTLDGSTVTLSALKGRPVLLNFWATWCGPCRSEMPYLQQLSDDTKWQARGLVLLAVNLEESEATVRKFMGDNGFSFTVLLDTAGEAGRLYNISAIPTTHIIDKDGIIKNSRTGAFAGKAQIEQAISSSITEE